MKASIASQQIATVCRTRHLSLQTERAYIAWFERFARHAQQRPELSRELKVATFLNNLAIERNVSPSTQAQALNAIAFFYKNVMKEPSAT